MWGFRVFVKGPFPLDNKVPLGAAHTLKQKLGLATVEPYEFTIVSDMWQRVPVGIRNKLNGEGTPTAQNFLIQESLIPADAYPIPTRLHNTKEWKNEKVVDWEALSGKVGEPDVGSMSMEERDGYVLACLWRHVAAVPDNARRNFVWTKKDGKIYNVDEDGVFRSDKKGGPSIFAFKEKKILASHVKERYESNLQSVLRTWVDTIKENRALITNAGGEYENILKRAESLAEKKHNIKAIFSASTSKKGKKRKHDDVDDE